MADGKGGLEELKASHAKGKQEKNEMNVKMYLE